MVDLRVSQDVVDGAALSLTASAGPLLLNSRITCGGAIGVLASSAVAGALASSTELQGLRAGFASTAMTELGANAAGSVAQMLAADADLARTVG